MYGLVNRALKDMVSERHGPDAWERVLTASGVENDVFVTNEGYPDAITVALVGGTAQVLDRPAADVLRDFGEYWLLVSGRRSYGHLLDAGGQDLPAFLMNLPNFHARVSLIFPHLTPPRFVVDRAGPGAARVHYHSDREGLAPFLEGLLRGMGTMFATPVRVEQVEDRAAGAGHDVFLVTWDPA